MKGLIISTLMIFAVMATGCGKKASNPVAPAPYFPDKIGSVWVYSVYDSLTESSYNLTVSVVDSTSINDRPATLWTFEGNGEVDSLYLTASGDTVMFFGHHGTYLEKEYVLPLTVGKEYGPNSRHYLVDKTGSVNVPAGRFANSYHIAGDFFNPNDHRTSGEWFVPGVGRVWEYRHGFCTVCSPMLYLNEVWELVGYRPAE